MQIRYRGLLQFTEHLESTGYGWLVRRLPAIHKTNFLKLNEFSACFISSQQPAVWRLHHPVPTNSSPITCSVQFPLDPKRPLDVVREQQTRRHGSLIDILAPSFSRWHAWQSSGLVLNEAQVHGHPSGKTCSAAKSAKCYWQNAYIPRALFLQSFKSSSLLFVY